MAKIISYSPLFEQEVLREEGAQESPDDGQFQARLYLRSIVNHKSLTDTLSVKKKSILPRSYLYYCIML